MEERCVTVSFLSLLVTELWLHGTWLKAWPRHVLNPHLALQSCESLPRPPGAAAGLGLGMVRMHLHSHSGEERVPRVS